MKHTRRSLAPFLIATTLLAATGCAGKKTVTITGTVKYQGKPVPVGAVYFYGADDKVAMGSLNKGGSFTATDVPIGEVRVSVQARDPGRYAQQMQGHGATAPRNQAAPFAGIPAKFADPNTSGVKYVIELDTEELEVILE